MALKKMSSFSDRLNYPPPNPDYHGLVDIGSNGVRFSITDLSPPGTRVMPTLFQDRCSISLYDAQFAGTNKAPIPDEVIDIVVCSLKRFRHVCITYGVPASNIRAVATEATREATNSSKFLEAIKSATGWDVELLPKEEEGRIGSWGIASSVPHISGLVMDLGGGSTQLSWLHTRKGETLMAANPVSLPYGAAALTKRLTTAIDDAAIEALKTELTERLQGAFQSLDLPPEISKASKQPSGINLYLSGGGFRGFGYVLLSQHPIQPYPIPIINGFTSAGDSFRALASGMHNASSADVRSAVADTFRISERRARQIPAVAFLITTLIHALPTIQSVIFCQGGVREGLLYSTLPQEIRTQDPLLIATQQYGTVSSTALAELMHNALPRSTPPAIRAIVHPLANIMGYHANVPKESRASCGLHSTSTGFLSAVHGLTHEVRALLALALCQRWGGEVHDSNVRTRLGMLVGGELEFWARYLGAISGLVGAVYPASIVLKGEDRIEFWVEEKMGKENGGERKDGRVILEIRGRGKDPVLHAVLQDGIKEIEKVGKKKRCTMGFRKKIVANYKEIANTG
ncbi:Ppx-GppA-domain-containing protein [Ascodesmis nigricans]|uniref:Ppx-GppA-domain-containing protein n=1 Tax=Ascodesmis nigricans TaxID=341454 RepID=A0A4S2MVF2_9PEZI|nr:Ppx-GppA-domain-containing protein [Ascodesmis nigricans]